MKRLVIPLAGLALMAGCAATTPVTDTPVDREGVCDSSTLAWTVGKTADEALVLRAQSEAGAKLVRVLRPGQMVTMEYSEYRLNLHVDANNQVTSYSCS